WWRRRQRYGQRAGGDQYRPERALDSDQYFRWYHPRRRSGQRDRPGARAGADQFADRDPYRRHQRLGGSRYSHGARLRPPHIETDDARSSAHSRRAGQHEPGRSGAMSIFVDAHTKVIYQGLTGSAGRFYGLRNRAYGTRVVGGTNPKRAGTDVEGIP